MKLGKLYVTVSVKTQDSFIRMGVNGVYDVFVLPIYASDIIGQVYLN